MKMRMTGGMSMELRQQLHRALWSAYLRGDTDVDRGPQSIASALEALLEASFQAPGANDLVIGTALWNLLDACSDKPPELFEQLMNEVLGLELAQALAIRRAPSYVDFPPVRQPIISESF